MGSLFHTKCQTILDFPKQKKPVVTVLCIQTEEVFVEYIKHKELKILSLATSGEKGISKDNTIL